jgi:hypothetical protein
MLVVAHYVVQLKNLQVLNTEVESVELLPDLNMYGYQLEGVEMLLENSSKVSRHVFTCFFMEKKYLRWLVQERNSDTTEEIDTVCVSESDFLDVYGTVGKELWKDDLYFSRLLIMCDCENVTYVCGLFFSWRCIYINRKIPDHTNM